MLLGITGTVEVTLDDGGQFPASSIIGELDGAESELLYGKCLDSELGNLGINGRTIQFAYDAGKTIESLQGSSELRLEPQLCDANVQLGFHGQLPIRRSTLSSLWRSASDLELVFTLSGSSGTLREIQPWWCRCYRPISIPIRHSSVFLVLDYLQQIGRGARAVVSELRRLVDDPRRFFIKGVTSVADWTRHFATLPSEHCRQSLLHGNRLRWTCRFQVLGGRNAAHFEGVNCDRHLHHKLLAPISKKRLLCRRYGLNCRTTPGNLVMKLRCLVVICSLLCLSRGLLAFEATGTLHRIDVEKGTVVIRVNGQERTVKVSKAIKVENKEGEAILDGLMSKELRDGTEVTLSVELEDGVPFVKAIRLGRLVTQNNKKRSSVGLKPLTEMTADDRYQGEDGGLYGGGENLPPEAHRRAALEASHHIVPLDEEGKPAIDGKIGLMSLGMSNTAGVWVTFKEKADRDPQKSANVVIVNGAVGGAGARSWANGPQGRPWLTVVERLKDANVSPRQVQVVWIKHADPMPSADTTVLEYAKNLKGWLSSIVRTLKSEYPNVQIVYLSSRTYGGYNAAGLRLVNPEPFAYESAFSVRWLIQDQIKGERMLNFDPTRGPVEAPLLLWGPYLWANGITPRQADQLVWERSDYGNDGVHQTPKGREKAADQLLRFFKNDSTAQTWFVKK